MHEAAKLEKEFHSRFGAAPALYRAPGRVNLIGEHIDYNDGFVMPAAIDFSCWVAIAPRDDRRLVVHSGNFGETFEFELDDPQPRPARKWSDYVRGVALALAGAGHRLRGANLLIRGNVPLGAGVSSSAALEVAVACALLDLAGSAIDRTEVARLCQRAENEFVGTRCGIMDQFISAHAHAGQVMMLDCRTLDFRMLPLAAGAQLVIANTMVRHEHAGGEYNLRRSECEEGVRRLAEVLPGIRALRDVSLPELERHRDRLSETIYRRCRHVISENQRVLDAAGALARGDLESVGRLMAESHRSLRDDYQVSCAKLDLMVELAVQQAGVWGSRMTGGGFGGCTISIVEGGAASGFQRAVAEGYERRTGRRPEIYVSAPAEGAGHYVVERSTTVPGG